MSLTPSFRLPVSIPEGVVHSSVKDAIEDHDNAILDLQQAIPALKNQITALGTPPASTSTGTSTTTAVSTQNVTNVTVGGGPVNNQTGVTAYTTAQSDNGALVIFNDASPVAVTLNNSVTLPWYFVIANYGAGTVTLTPQQGTLTGSVTVPTGYAQSIYFDGSGFWGVIFPIVPVTTSGVAHEWLASYNAATGVFTLSQPAFSDISGTLASSQLPSSGLTATIVTAKLTTGGAEGSQTYTNGLLTAQTPAT
jgi:hypothetical protein